MAQGIETRITGLRKKVKDAELREVQIKTKMESANERLKEAQTKCQEYGVEPDQLEETIDRLDKKMNTLATSIEELLPEDDNDAF